MIKVAGGYYIDADSKCYWFGKLSKTVNKKTGETVTSVTGEGYYTTFGGALQGVVRRLRMEAIAKADCDLEEALEVIKKCDAKITRVVKQFDELSISDGETEKTEKPPEPVVAETPQTRRRKKAG